MAFTSKTLKEAVKLWFQDRAKAEATYGTIGSWDTSKVDDMSRLFSAMSVGSYYNSQAKDFNEDISRWDTSKVTNMQYMFREAAAFNQDTGTCKRV